MKVDPAENAGAPLFEPRGRESDGYRNFAGWLRALEQAQWEQRLRYEKAAGEGNPTERGANAEEPVASGKGLQTRDGASLGGKPAARGASAGEAGAPREASGSPSPPASSRGAGSEAHVPTAPATHGARHGGGRVTDAAVEPAAPRSEAPHWGRQFMHAALGADGVYIWLRDARLEADSGAKLLLALRKQLSGCGLELAELVLNGRPVSGNPANEQ